MQTIGQVLSGSLGRLAADETLSTRLVTLSACDGWVLGTFTLVYGFGQFGSGLGDEAVVLHRVKGRKGVSRHGYMTLRAAQIYLRDTYNMRCVLLDE